MLKLKKAALAEDEGIRIVRKPKAKIYNPETGQYNKNSLFGLAVDSIKKLCDQKKLVMYLSPNSKEEQKEKEPGRTGQVSNAESPNLSLRGDAESQAGITPAGERKNSVVSPGAAIVSPGAANLVDKQSNSAVEPTLQDSLCSPSSTFSPAPGGDAAAQEIILQQTASAAEQYVIETESDIEEEKLATPKNIDEVIGLAATSIGKNVGANCIISVERKQNQLMPDLSDDDKFINVEVVIFRKTNRNAYKKVTYHTKIRKLLQGSILPIKDVLSEAINKQYIKKGDRVVCVEDESIGLGYKGMLFIFDVDSIFFNISMAHLTDIINSDVLEAVINLAVEIGKDGFEGKPIGTAFVIGDRNDIAPYTKQMIINPFMSCPEEQRKIIDPALKDTIKNFAQLDGAFIVDKSGVVISAGTYLNVDVDRELSDSLSGLGTRHRSCAAITKATKSIAVVVSQSGGKIRIFKEGQLIMRLP